MRIIPAKPRRPQEANAFTAIPAPDALMRKALIVDGSFEDAALPAIRRAEAAAKRVREQSRNLVPEEIERLSQAFREYREKAEASEPNSRLFRLVHDLRGMAAGLDQPLIERIARSMSRLMAHCAAPSRVLLQAHVDALRAAARDGIRDTTNPLVSELVGELERRTQKSIDGNKP
jgi:chemotaxis protein histidine kinase CheA